MLYGTLKQYHPAHGKSRWEDIRLLYAGGWELIDHAKRLLIPAKDESPADFDRRQKLASYVGYFGQVVDFLAGATFFEALSLTPTGSSELPDDYWEEFDRNADRDGLTFSGLMCRALTEALLLKTAWIACDFPSLAAGTVLTSRADEEKLGLTRGYAYLEPSELILDWQEDAGRQLRWLVTHRVVCDRESPEAKRDAYREVFRVWTLGGQGDTRRAVCTTYETRPLKLAGDQGEPEKPRPDDELTQSSVVRTAFRSIPFARLTLPDGMWVGNRVGPLALEHFRRRSNLAASLDRGLVEIPVANLAPEIGGMGEALPSEAAMDPGRGSDPVSQFNRRGYVVLGDKDKLSFVGPSGKAYESARADLAELRDEIYRTVTAMALASPQSAAAMTRSGNSKREDRTATEVVLGTLAARVRIAALEVYRIIAEARGEDVEWETHGLSRFNLTDIAESVTQALDVAGLDIPSPTFKARYLTKIATTLVQDADVETREKIREEIEANAESMGHETDAVAEMLNGDTEAEDDAGPESQPGREGAGANPQSTPGRDISGRSDGPPRRQGQRRR